MKPQKEQMGKKYYKKAKSEARWARIAGNKYATGVNPYLDTLRLGKVSAKINDIDKKLTDLNPNKYKSQFQKIHLTKA